MDRTVHQDPAGAEAAAPPPSPRSGVSAEAQARRHRRLALACSLTALFMLGAAFAAVPLYRLFCQATGYGGTVMRAARPFPAAEARTITVRFDANVRNLPWTFEPERRTETVRLGETVLAFFRATNTSDKPVTGTAVFNVAPEIAGGYFNKIECFCFTEQRLEPGETAELPVSFYVDPAIANDGSARRLTEITLSYTFYPASAPAAAPRSAGRSGAAPPAGG